MQKSSEVLFSVPEDLVNKAVEKYQQGKRFEYNQNQVVSDKGIPFGGVEYVFHPRETDKLMELQKQLINLRADIDESLFDLSKLNENSEPFVVYDRVSACIVSLKTLDYLNLIVANYGKNNITDKPNVWIMPEIIFLSEWLSDKDWTQYEFLFSNQAMISNRKIFKRFMKKHVVENPNIAKINLSNKCVVNVLHSTTSGLEAGLLGKGKFFPTRDNVSFYPKWYFRSFNSILESLKLLFDNDVEFDYKGNDIVADNEHLYYLTENGFILSNEMLRERFKFTEELKLKQSLQELLIKQCGAGIIPVPSVPKPKFELHRIKIKEVERLYMFDYAKNRDFKTMTYNQHREYFEMIYFRHWHPYMYILETPQILEYKMLKAQNNIFNV